MAGCCKSSNGPSSSVKYGEFFFLTSSGVVSFLGRALLDAVSTLKDTPDPLSPPHAAGSAGALSTPLDPNPPVTGNDARVKGKRSQCGDHFCLCLAVGLKRKLKFASSLPLHLTFCAVITDCVGVARHIS